MKKWCLLLWMSIVSMPSAAIVNQLIASVGHIAITSYDIQQMREFQFKIAQKRPSAAEALELLITMSALLVLSEENTEYYMDEVELRKTINTMTNDPADPNSKQRKKIYEDHSEIYRMTMRADKAKRSMMFGDVKIKDKINRPISPKEAQQFYKKHKNQFKDSPFPKFDVIIFAVESSPRWTLAELSEVEEKMQNLAKDLDTSSDFNAMRKKYSSLKFTSYSGRTGLFTPDILIMQKKVPDEILGIALQPSLNLGPVNIPIKKNIGIYIPQPIPFRSTGVSTYLTMKIMNVVQPSQLNFEEALPKIEEAIKYQRGEKAVQETIKERIAAGQITLTPVGKSYTTVFRKFK